MRAFKDPIFLCLLLGPLLWMALSSPFVDRGDLAQACRWVFLSFCFNLALVSIFVPWLMRANQTNEGR